MEQKSLFIFSFATPQRTAYREVPSQMAVHLRTGSPLLAGEIAPFEPRTAVSHSGVTTNEPPLFPKLKIRLKQIKSKLRTIGHYLIYDNDILANCPCHCGLFYFRKQLQNISEKVWSSSRKCPLAAFWYFLFKNTERARQKFVRICPTNSSHQWCSRNNSR